MCLYMECKSRAGASYQRLLRMGYWLLSSLSKGSATLESGSITGHSNPDNQVVRNQGACSVGPDNWKS